MRWLEILGILPKGDSKALRLDETSPWVVAETKDGATFYRALGHLATPESVLYLEGSTEPHVPRLLATMPAARARQVKIGTLWPRSDTYHVAATPEALTALADLIAQHHIALPAIHTHLYDQAGMILEWHDAFTEPMRISRRVSEDTVRRFADAIGKPYGVARYPV